MDAFKCKTRICKSRQKLSSQPATICKHIILLKSRVSGYGRDYEGEHKFPVYMGLVTVPMEESNNGFHMPV